MNSPRKRPTCETQRGDSEVLELIVLTAAAVGAFNIANCGSMTLDDLAEVNPELAAALEECGQRFEEAVSVANYSEHHDDCWYTPYDGMMCESDYAGRGQEWRDLFSQAEANGWRPVVDRSEPEPKPMGTLRECRTMAADAGLEPCLGQGWTYEQAGGMVFAISSPDKFCPAN